MRCLWTDCKQETAPAAAHPPPEWEWIKVSSAPTGVLTVVVEGVLCPKHAIGDKSVVDKRAEIEAEAAEAERKRREALVAAQKAAGAPQPPVPLQPSGDAD